MKPKHLAGAFRAQKKDGTFYYRSSITYRNKHISLGSFKTEEMAHHAYLEANRLLLHNGLLLPEDYPSHALLSFEKWVILVNYKANNIYMKNPIYMKKGYFIYYLSQNHPLIFDIDDLFFYSEHKIMKRNGHLFVADYGMQINILSRYGIKNYSVPGIDYVFVNGNPNDFRYENIHVINPYNGVRCLVNEGQEVYEARILINGSFLIGRYSSPEEAAIAYNKAIDLLKKAGSPKNYQPNYIEHLSGMEYANLYIDLKISPRLYTVNFQ